MSKVIIFNVEHKPTGAKAMHLLAPDESEARRLALQKLKLPLTEANNLKVRLSNNQLYDVEHKPTGQVARLIEARDARAARRKGAGVLKLPKTEVTHCVVVKCYWK